MLGFAFVEPQDIQDLQLHISTLVNQYDINLPLLPEFDLSRVEAEWMRLRKSIPEVWKYNNDGREFQVGDAMRARGLSAEHPVVLIPGIVSTVSVKPLPFPLLITSSRASSPGRLHKNTVHSSERNCGEASICCLKSLSTRKNG